MSPRATTTTSAITFSGPVDDLAEHIAAADVCLCPIFAGGGTRMKLLEYMAAAQAIVSSTKGAEGIAYVDGRDLASPMRRGLRPGGPRPPRRPAEARRLGQRARAFASRYDWRHIADAYLQTYRGEGRGEDWNHRLEPDPIDAALAGAGLRSRRPPSPGPCSCW